MSDYITVLVPATNTRTKKNQKPLDILFTPTIEWIKMALGNTPRCAVLGGLDFAHATALTTKELPWWLRDQNAEHVLIIGADAPLICEGEIRASYEYYLKNRRPVTLLSDDNKFVTGAGWYQKEALIALMADFPDVFALDRLLREIEISSITKNSFVVNKMALLPADSSINRALLSEAACDRIRKIHLYQDVDIPLSDGVMIAPTVTIGKGTTILSGTILKGTTAIGENCTIGPNTQLENVVVGNATVLNMVQAEDCVIGAEVKIGPMSHVRPHSQIADQVKIGNFVEIKNSTIGQKTSVSHLTYVGDSDVGEGCNFGCGVVTVNYDGTNKNRTTIGNHAFIGCNCNLIAPVTLGDHSYAAAGTTITDSVPEDALVIGRVRQTVKEGWHKKRGLFDKA